MRQCTPPPHTLRHAAAFQRRVAPYGRVKSQSSPALQEIREKIPFTAAAPRPRRPCQCTLVGAACPCAAIFSAVPRPTGASTPTHPPRCKKSRKNSLSPRLRRGRTNLGDALLSALPAPLPRLRRGAGPFPSGCALPITLPCSIRAIRPQKPTGAGVTAAARRTPRFK